MDLMKNLRKMIGFWNAPMDHLRLKEIIAVTVFAAIAISLCVFAIISLASHRAGAAQAFQAGGAVAAVLPGFAGVILAAVALYSYIKTEDVYFTEAKKILSHRRALGASIASLQHSIVHNAKVFKTVEGQYRKSLENDDAFKQKTRSFYKRTLSDQSNQTLPAVKFRKADHVEQEQALSWLVEKAVQEEEPRRRAGQEWTRGIYAALKAHAPDIKRHLVACNAVMIHCKALDERDNNAGDERTPEPDEPVTAVHWTRGMNHLLHVFELALSIGEAAMKSINANRIPDQDLDEQIIINLRIALLMTGDALEDASIDTPEAIYRILTSSEFGSLRPAQFNQARKLAREEWSNLDI